MVKLQTLSKRLCTLRKREKSTKSTIKHKMEERDIVGKN